MNSIQREHPQAASTQPTAGRPAPESETKATAPAVSVTDRAWWIGKYFQWTTVNPPRDTPVAVAAFARAAESAGWIVVLRAGTQAVDDDTSVGIWEVECTGRAHDSRDGGQANAVLSVMWSQSGTRTRWSFDADRSTAEMGNRTLAGIVALADYKKAARQARVTQQR
ncbi:hypothetical protein OG321_42265 [Streptomyces sp. NBC_00424]|uniref:hypothetical protein n=1 Tax=Streptomyces sp. NBC_00424 TaxID=2903648 RepID=UPI00225BE0BA|nr:hypothetical protein [Streptomyces sp. NBC_00424]MCX5079023.1 hypothetical protein [Streptomyces sp. NBC_00424]